MEEDNKASDEFQFSFEVAEGFFENFSSFFPLQLMRINNNAILPPSLKLSLLLDLEKKALNPKGNLKEKGLKMPEKQDISLYLNEKFTVEKLWTDLNEGKIAINEEKTKFMMICDFSERNQKNQYLFLLNKEWVERKKQEIEENERKRLKSLYEEQLRQLKDPYFHDILNKIRDFSWKKPTFDVKLENGDFVEISLGKFRRNMRKIMLKD